MFQIIGNYNNRPKFEYKLGYKLIKEGEDNINIVHKKFKFINFMTVNYIRNVTLYLILLQIYFNVTYYTLNIEMSDFGSLNWNLNMSAIFEILGILISGNIIINLFYLLKYFKLI